MRLVEANGTIMSAAMASDARRSPVRFGIFELDLTSGELRRRGVKVRLQEQPLRALVALTECPGVVLTRVELQHILWPSGTTVDFDRGLNKAINRLREALGDDADDPRFIETHRSWSVEELTSTSEAVFPETLVAILASIEQADTSAP
jgi:DNA-binding response OmpR family regulator